MAKRSKTVVARPAAKKITLPSIGRVNANLIFNGQTFLWDNSKDIKNKCNFIAFFYCIAKLNRRGQPISDVTQHALQICNGLKGDE